jgi:hypothetical protein
MAHSRFRSFLDRHWFVLYQKRLSELHQRFRTSYCEITWSILRIAASACLWKAAILLDGSRCWRPRSWSTGLRLGPPILADKSSIQKSKVGSPRRVEGRPGWGLELVWEELILLIGCLVGNDRCALSDAYGRKRILIVAAVLLAGRSDFQSKKWWAQRDLNPRPSDYEG